MFQSSNIVAWCMRQHCLALCVLLLSWPTFATDENRARREVAVQGDKIPQCAANELFSGSVVNVDKLFSISGVQPKEASEQGSWCLLHEALSAGLFTVFGEGSSTVPSVSLRLSNDSSSYEPLVASSALSEKCNNLQASSPHTDSAASVVPNRERDTWIFFGSFS
mmetsp:Transcript_37008/g.95960  ORF Transcript_37008/g.95960 Transcript_37008/m.95960 type:complete len:165 (-) Transcript_37008:1267-1761(-)